MTRSLSRELGADGIAVNAIAPGMTRVEATDSVSEERHQRYPAGRAIKKMMYPEDLVGTGGVPAVGLRQHDHRPAHRRERRLLVPLNRMYNYSAREDEHAFCHPRESGGPLTSARTAPGADRGRA